VPNLPPSTLYGWRVTGSSAGGDGCDAGVILVDPLAHAVHSRAAFGQPAADGDCWPQMLAALPQSESESFDWRGVSSPRRALEDLVIYECSVRGFTAAESSRTRSPRGTLAALEERLPHLVGLGVNALELLPLAEFNEMELFDAHSAGAKRVNFWGYSTVAFAAPMSRFAQPGRACAELKSLVRACHAAGVEVILDVVFNHSAEGNEQGPTLSLRGLDEAVYYITAPTGEHYNYSGCGNTLNCNHPVVRRFILDCLRRWAVEYRIDGFRFDLASILTRASSSWEAAAVLGEGEGPLDASVVRGTPLVEPPLLDLLSNDGVLRGCKLIAEAWDAGGLYQVGTFPHWGVWAEWNGKFRDSARQFVRGTDGAAGDFAERLCGSPSLYARGRRPGHSVNFVTAHDGFTLADLVAYNSKRNAANGEEGRDGEEHNLSWNCGDGPEADGEGPGVDAAVRTLRRRQQRNLLAALFLSQGVPMLTQGDEVGHSKGGNNNTYCHDSQLNWLDWDAVRADIEGLLRFTRALAAFRARHACLRLRSHPDGSQVAWHGVKPFEADWSEASRLVAFTLTASGEHPQLYVAFNASHTPLALQLPPPGEGRAWRLALDTALPPPWDMPADDCAPELRQAAAAQHACLGACLYTAMDRSTVVCESAPLLM
jgi:isoamylase